MAIEWKRIKTEFGNEYHSTDGRFIISKDDYGTARWALVDNKGGFVSKSHTKKEAEQEAEFYLTHEFTEDGWKKIKS